MFSEKTFINKILDENNDPLIDLKLYRSLNPNKHLSAAPIPCVIVTPRKTKMKALRMLMTMNPNQKSDPVFGMVQKVFFG